MLYIDLSQDRVIPPHLKDTLTIDNRQKKQLRAFLGIGQEAIHTMTRKLHKESVRSRMMKKTKRKSLKPLHGMTKIRDKPYFFELQPVPDNCPNKHWRDL